MFPAHSFQGQPNPPPNRIHLEISLSLMLIIEHSGGFALLINCSTTRTCCPASVMMGACLSVLSHLRELVLCAASFGPPRTFRPWVSV